MTQIRHRIPPRLSTWLARSAIGFLHASMRGSSLMSYVTSSPFSVIQKSKGISLLMKRMEHRRNKASILADSFEDLCVMCSLFFVVKFARTTKNSKGLHHNSSGASRGSSSL
jgi:hypothetical protein